MKTFKHYLTKECGLSIDHMKLYFTRMEFDELIATYSDYLTLQIEDSMSYHEQTWDIFDAFLEEARQICKIIIDDRMLLNDIEQSLLEEDDRQLHGEFQEEYEHDCYQRAIDMRDTLTGNYYE